MKAAKLQQLITYLEDAQKDLSSLSRAGVDVGYPQLLRSKVIEDLEKELEG